MLGRLRGWIHRIPFWGQMMAWPLLYFPAWVVGQVFSSIGWMLAEIYSQAAHALQHFLHKHSWVIAAVVLFGGIALLAPRIAGPLLQLAIMVALMCWATLFLFRGVFPRKKKKAEKDKGRGGH